MRHHSIVAAASVAIAACALGAPASAAEKCFNKATLTYEDCPKPPAPVAPAPAPVAPVAPPKLWGGPYIGAHAGYAWANADLTSTALSDADFLGFELEDDEFDIEGFLAGGQIGYLHQYDSNLVLGIELDGSWTWADDEIGVSALADSAGSIDIGEYSGELDYLLSARVRLGYGLDRVMPYMTAGVAYSGWDFDSDLDDGNEDDDITAFGGVVGGGLEFLATEHIVVGAEGLYYFFDEEGAELGSGADQVEVGDVIVARIRASYKF